MYFQVVICYLHIFAWIWDKYSWKNCNYMNYITIKPLEIFNYYINFYTCTYVRSSYHIQKSTEVSLRLCRNTKCRSPTTSQSYANTWAPKDEKYAQASSDGVCLPETTLRKPADASPRHRDRIKNSFPWPHANLCSERTCTTNTRHLLRRRRWRRVNCARAHAHTRTIIILPT